MSKAGVAALLSFFVPGLGQLYNGALLRALIWFLLCGLTWPFAGPFTLIAHAVCAYTAFSYAEQRERRLLPAR
ncbi:MAG: hypothetical protein ACK4N5_20535 [Myxococcales bacterium]